jgi:hypothetical protein
MGAINSSIPLMVQQPQVANPLDEYQKSLQIKSLIGQQQLQQQAMQAQQTEQQGRELQLKQAQQNDADMQTLRETAPKYVSKGPDGVGRLDYDGLSNDLASRGVNPAMIQKLQTDHYALVEAASKAGKESLDNQTAHNKAAYEVLEGIKGVTDPDQRASAYTQGLNKLKVLGMDTSSLPATPPDDKALEAYETQLGMHGQLLADAKTAADTKKENAEALEKQWQKFPELGALVNTDTGEVRNVSGGMMSPAMLESKYVALQQKKNTPGQTLSADEIAFNKGYERYKQLVPIYNIQNQINPGGLGPTGPTPPATGPTPPNLPGGPGAAQGKGTGAAPQVPPVLTEQQNPASRWPGLERVPGNIRGEVQQVLDYRRADPSITQRGVVGQLINQWVANLDPTHDALTFPQRGKTLSDFQKDASTGELGAVNTALGHLGELYTAAKELGKNLPFTESNFPLLHSLANKVGIATGDDAASTYQSILHRVGPEMTKAYLKSGGTKDERGSNEDDFDISKGQQQIISNIAESAQLLNSKLASKKQAWETGFNPTQDKDQFEKRFLTSDAKNTLGALSSLAPTNKANQGGGAVGGRPAEATHTGISSKDGKKYWLDANGKKLGPAE